CPPRTPDCASYAVLLLPLHPYVLLFSVNATPSTEIYTLSLHDALPISKGWNTLMVTSPGPGQGKTLTAINLAISLAREMHHTVRSEEHTSELQSPYDLVCRLLLEKKNKIIRDRYLIAVLRFLHFVVVAF